MINMLIAMISMYATILKELFTWLLDDSYRLSDLQNEIFEILLKEK